MKNVKFYPKRLIIVGCLFLVIPLATVIAKVADIHLPNGEEMNMMEKEKSDWDKTSSTNNDSYEKPDSNIPEPTKEETDFDTQRTYDQCNGIEEEKKSGDN